MKKNLSKTAFSLIELIVTSLLVIIVMLGAFSINSVLTNNNQDYGQRYSVKSVTQITLNHILNNASLAVGSGTADNYGNIDQGILWGAGNPPEITNGVYNNFNGVGDPNSFCIHQAANNNIVNVTRGILLQILLILIKFSGAPLILLLPGPLTPIGALLFRVLKTPIF